MTLKEDHSEEVANMMPHVLAQQVEQAEIFPIPESVCNFLWNLIPSDICSVVMTPDPENPIYVWCVIFGFCVDVLWGIVPRLLCGLPPYSEDVANTVPHVVAQQVEQAKPNPIPEFVCNVLSNKSLEDQAVGGICKVVTKLFPAIPFDPDCETVGEELWDAGLALLCSGAKEEGHSKEVQDPLPPSIKKIVCEVVSNPDIENKAVEGVCEEVTKLFPEVPFDCKTALEELWSSSVARFCSEAESSMGVADPLQRATATTTSTTPPTIEQLLCEIASNPDIEDKAVEGMCEEVKNVFPDLFPWPLTCTTVLDKVWSKGVASLCPETELSVGAADQLPPAIEEFLCQIALNQ